MVYQNIKAKGWRLVYTIEPIDNCTAVARLTPQLLFPESIVACTRLDPVMEPIVRELTMDSGPKTIVTICPHQYQRRHPVMNNRQRSGLHIDQVLRPVVEPSNKSCCC